MTPVRGMILCLFSRDLVALPHLVYTRKTSDLRVDSIIRVVEWGGWPSTRVQANIWQLYTTTFFCQINQLWRQQDSCYLLGCLHIAESMARLSNTPSVVKQLNAGQSGRKLEEKRNTYKWKEEYEWRREMWQKQCPVEFHGAFSGGKSIIWSNLDFKISGFRRDLHEIRTLLRFHATQNGSF